MGLAAQGQKLGWTGDRAASVELRWSFERTVRRRARRGRGVVRLLNSLWSDRVPYLLNLSSSHLEEIKSLQSGVRNI